MEEQYEHVQYNDLEITDATVTVTDTSVAIESSKHDILLTPNAITSVMHKSESNIWGSVVASVIGVTTFILLLSVLTVNLPTLSFSSLMRFAGQIVILTVISITSAIGTQYFIEKLSVFQLRRVKLKTNTDTIVISTPNHEKSTLIYEEVRQLVNKVFSK